jgi:hypothetical protein
MPFPSWKIAIAASLLSLGLFGCASPPPLTASSFDLYDEAVDIFPIAFECIGGDRVEEIVDLRVRFQAVKEWLRTQDPVRIAQSDATTNAGEAEPTICTSASNRRYEERRRVAALLAELERRMRQDEAR